MLLLLLAPSLAAETTVQAALSDSLRTTPAVGMVIAINSGKFVAEVNAAEAGNRSTPGSLLKPLFLARALEQHDVMPQTAVFCRRDLHINERGREWDLACTHLQSDVPFTAQEALAYSCNRYFAALADRMPPPKVAAILEHYGLGREHPPQTREQTELLVLGLAGVTVSPAQIAMAYRKLALELNASSTSPTLDPVRNGLRDSVNYGMAHNAAVPGMKIAGKTGTASTHGWFAGITYLGDEEVVIVIYLPGGNGADAARLAQHFFLAAAVPLRGIDSAQESARLLTVELWSARSVTHLTATPRDGTTPLQVDWTPDGLRTSAGKTLRQLALSGSFRMQRGDAPEVTAAGKWTIDWRRDGVRVLLTLPSENYVMAALSGEAAPEEPLASLKAMAISMRTFALANADRHYGEGFGLCDSTHCQALRLGKVRPEVERAVRETAGETLWSAGHRAHIYYTQHCGGTSERAGVVWPAEQASYLAGNRADPYCLRRSPAEWHTRIELDELSGIFRTQGWRTPASIETIRVVRRSEAGRAELLQITGHGAPAQLSASSFRFAVDRALGWNQMRSDWFSVTVSAGFLEIQGRGYGHGVGLCQAGAYQMAADGHSAAEILASYFPGTVAGITPLDRGWRQVPGTGWTLLTTGPSTSLVAEGNAAWTAAWSKAQPLLGGSSAVLTVAPTVQELPTTELFRQTTEEPGWMLASTRGATVFLQPAKVRQDNAGALLLHEFLHVLVERQAGDQAPLWLREGLVETLAGSGQDRMDAIDLPPGEVEEALLHPASVAASRHAHQVAARMAARLCARYGMPAVRDFLHNGVPSAAVRSLGS